MQAEFKFAPEPKPSATSHELNALLAYLRGKLDWTKSKTITGALGLNERKIRSLASQSEGLILSGPGCPGYKHLLNAEAKEVAEVSTRLKHQADAMLTRAIAIQSAYHKAPYQNHEQEN